MDKCPVRSVTAFSLLQLRLYSHYKKGFLLYAGGVADQPSKYLEAMEIIGSAVAEEHAEEIDKMKNRT